MAETHAHETPPSQPPADPHAQREQAAQLSDNKQRLAEAKALLESLIDTSALPPERKEALRSELLSNMGGVLNGTLDLGTFTARAKSEIIAATDAERIEELSRYLDEILGPSLSLGYPGAFAAIRLSAAQKEIVTSQIQFDVHDVDSQIAYVDHQGPLNQTAEEKALRRDTYFIAMNTPQGSAAAIEYSGLSREAREAGATVEQQARSVAGAVAKQTKDARLQEMYRAVQNGEAMLNAQEVAALRDYADGAISSDQLNSTMTLQTQAVEAQLQNNAQQAIHAARHPGRHDALAVAVKHADRQGARLDETNVAQTLRALHRNPKEFAEASAIVHSLENKSGEEVEKILSGLDAKTAANVGMLVVALTSEHTTGLRLHTAIAQESGISREKAQEIVNQIQITRSQEQVEQVTQTARSQPADISDKTREHIATLASKTATPQEKTAALKAINLAHQTPHSASDVLLSAVASHNPQAADQALRNAANSGALDGVVAAATLALQKAQTAADITGNLATNLTTTDKAVTDSVSTRLGRGVKRTASAVIGEENAQELGHKVTELAMDGARAKEAAIKAVTGDVSGALAATSNLLSENMLRYNRDQDIENALRHASASDWQTLSKLKDKNGHALIEDKDHNGQLSWDEVKAGFAKLHNLANADKNQDQHLSLQELVAAAKQNGFDVNEAPSGPPPTPQGKSAAKGTAQVRH